MMVTCTEHIESLDGLRNYVNEVLCEHDQFEIGAFDLAERILVRAGKPCGVYFCLHGPRNIRSTAIWESDRNAIFFYDSAGERFLKVQLVAALPAYSMA